MTANINLPRLNPLKARSTVALIVTLGAIVAPGIFAGLDPEATGETAGHVIASLNEIIAAAGRLWMWIERKAPHFRLGFRG